MCGTEICTVSNGVKSMSMLMCDKKSREGLKGAGCEEKEMLSWKQKQRTDARRESEKLRGQRD